MTATSLRRQPRRPTGAPRRMLTVRVPADVYVAAQEQAAASGETMSAAVVTFLRGYAGVPDDTLREQG